jgi:hypothetical protein
MSDNSRTELGENFLRIVWYSIATKVVEKAIIIYKLDEEQADALRKMYLKINHYTIETY